jgi:hypothetical protein
MVERGCRPKNRMERVQLAPPIRLERRARIARQLEFDAGHLFVLP